MSQVHISIEYKLVNSSQWHLVKLLPEDYFDLDVDEEIEWDCVPEYDHAIDYLDIDKTSISCTKISIIDSKAEVTKTITETFWNQGKNRIIERIDKGQKVSYWLMIININLQDNPPISEILRFERDEENLPKICSHVLIRENENGCEEEKEIYP
jgi:hypothetical protein